MTAVIENKFRTVEQNMDREVSKVLVDIDLLIRRANKSMGDAAGADVLSNLIIELHRRMEEASGA